MDSSQFQALAQQFQTGSKLKDEELKELEEGLSHLNIDQTHESATGGELTYEEETKDSTQTANSKGKKKKKSNKAKQPSTTNGPASNLRSRIKVFQNNQNVMSKIINKTN